MPRRGVGAGAIARKKKEAEKFKERGNELAAQQLEQLSSQLETFHTNLEEFASKHKQEIRKNPEFRHQFQQMCATIGVDPLASGKGFWSEMLGVGDFYYELGVKAVEICIATRPVNGGIMTLRELHQKLMKTKNKHSQDVSMEDIKMAIKKLDVLGTGFTLIGKHTNDLIVQSVPSELSMDHTAILEIAQKNNGCIDVSSAANQLSWTSERIESVVNHLVHEGMAWIDNQAPNGERWFWIPAFFTSK